MIFYLVSHGLNNEILKYLSYLDSDYNIADLTGFKVNERVEVLNLDINVNQIIYWQNIHLFIYFPQ
jgi:hypothetical protein